MPRNPNRKVMKLYEAYELLFIKNELGFIIPEKGRKLIDAELREILEDYFPEKIGKSTLIRIAMMRSFYNRSLDMFRFRPLPGKTKSRPISYGYTVDGEVTKRGRFLGSKNKTKYRKIKLIKEKKQREKDRKHLKRFRKQEIIDREIEKKRILALRKKRGIKRKKK